MAPKGFQYKTLRYAEPHFRLLQLGKQRDGPIQCELIDAFFDHDIDEHDGRRQNDGMLPYVAISYRWDPNQSSKDTFIMIGDSRFYVTHGVLELLKNLQRADNSDIWLSESRCVWLDAICIDQENEREKGHQIAYMRRIYSSASMVLIWLGGRTRDSDNVINVSSTLSKRAWILQEVSNASRAFVLCGQRSVSSQYFTAAPKLVDVQLSSHCQAVLDLMPGPYRQKLSDVDLRTLFARLPDLEASEDKDHVFALLGLYSGPTEYLASFYDKPISDMIRALFAHFLSSDFESVPPELCNSYESVKSFISQMPMLDSGIFDYVLEHPDSAFTNIFLSSLQHNAHSVCLDDNQILELVRGGLQAPILLDHILDHRDKFTYHSSKSIPLHPDITVAFTEVYTLIAIVENKIVASSVMRILLQRCPERLDFSFVVVCGLTRNKMHAPEILKEIAIRLPSQMDQIIFFLIAIDKPELRRRDGASNLTLLRDIPAEDMVYTRNHIKALILWRQRRDIETIPPGKMTSLSGADLSELVRVGDLLGDLTILKAILKKIDLPESDICRLISEGHADLIGPSHRIN
ncbi:heterokaryon incompatibility protein-domain-containing protein [Xylariaceae sp. FL0255]|nr:heterokaryon incompatibility protein-domain-containing protein [Xylariaceae sp. FL0255]